MASEAQPSSALLVFTSASLPGNVAVAIFVPADLLVSFFMLAIDASLSL